MAARFIEEVDPTSAQTISDIIDSLKNMTAKGVVPLVADGDTGLLNYYDRVNSLIRVLVNLNQAQTLTSKTLTAPTITAPTISGVVTDSSVKNGPAPVAQAAGTALSVTAALHAGKTIYCTDTDGITLTLEAATGTGNKYRVVVGAAIASAQLRINVSAAGQAFVGIAYVMDEDTAVASGFRAGVSADADQINLNGTTSGGQVGDVVELEDVASGVWQVNAFLTCVAGSNSATPFATGQVS